MRLKHQQRFRYGNPTSYFGLFRKYSSVLYFVAAWNVVGFTLWKIYDQRQSKNDPTWDHLSSAQKVTKASAPTVWKTAEIKHIVLFGEKGPSKNSKEVLED